MARARKSDNRSGQTKRSPARAPRKPDVEHALLELARRIERVAAEAEPAPTPLRDVLEAMLATHAAHGTAWLAAWQRARTDKRAALALGWAREQLRIAVVEVLAREMKAARLKGEAPLDALAWIIVTASEAAATDAAANAGERLDALLAVIGPVPA